MKRLVPFLLALAPALAAAEATTWKIDPAHTQTTFAVRHLVISTVRGEFKSTNGVVTLDAQDPSKSSVEATIDAATIHTREDKRDEHLRSPDFLDVQKHPTITFRSTKVEKADDDRYKVTGDLTLNGTTRPVVLETTLTPEIKDMQGMARRGVQATTRINRQEFGVRWSKTVEAGPVVGDQIDIEINAEVVKAAAEKSAAAPAPKAQPAAAKGAKAR
jgi:polyisoprenoid-binding protein YceI